MRIEWVRAIETVWLSVLSSLAMTRAVPSGGFLSEKKLEENGNDARGEKESATQQDRERESQREGDGEIEGDTESRSLIFAHFIAEAKIDRDLYVPLPPDWTPRIDQALLSLSLSCVCLLSILICLLLSLSLSLSRVSIC